MVEVGTKIGDRYKIIGEIGHGGMANVYLAQDLILDREVAVKVLRFDFQNDHVAIRRFQREALAATELVHPNIVQVYDVGEEKGMQFLVMEYVKGMDLKEYIKRNYPIPYAKVVDIMEQILSAVTLAHQHQIIHRDIKPQNILINEDGVVKITDFGIAIALSETSITQTNTLLGSVHYLSPEQARGGMATSQSDIYALGIVLYELLTGAVPFEGESAVSIALKHFQNDLPSIRDVDPRIPQPLENVVLKSTAKEPADRYQTTREMANDLSTCLSPERRNEPKFVPMALIAETKVMSVPQQEAKKKPEKQKAVNQEDKAVSAAKKKSPKKQPTRKKNTSVKALLGIVAGLLVIVVGSFLFMILSAPSTVSVPDVSSLSVTEAAKELESANLKVNTETLSFPSQEIAEGLVVKTSPEKNQKVKENAEVTLYVSSGGDKSKLGDYTSKNMTFDEAKQELIRLGFKDENITKKEETSEDLAEGIIISQSPSAGTEVDPATEVVELTVSKGQETFELRDMSGYSKSEVQNYLEGRGLALSTTTAYSDEVQKNYVISTNPGSGASVKKGDTITVVFSDGPEPVSSASSSSSSSSSSSQSGAVVKTVVVKITIPHDGSADVNTLKVYIGDATRSINNLDKELKLNPTAASGNVTATLQLREGEEGSIMITRNDIEVYSDYRITESYSYP